MAITNLVIVDGRHVHNKHSIVGRKLPYKSVAQERYFNVNRAKLERQGVDVDEWNRASKGKKLPRKVKPKRVHRGVTDILQ